MLLPFFSEYLWEIRSRPSHFVICSISRYILQFIKRPALQSAFPILPYHDVGVKRCQTDCFALRAPTILQNIRNSWVPFPTSSSCFGGSQGHSTTLVQARCGLRPFDPGIISWLIYRATHKVAMYSIWKKITTKHAILPAKKSNGMFHYFTVTFTLI